MEEDTHQLLNNPVWQALQTEHQPYAVGTAQVQRYPNQMLPFIACADAATADLNQLEPWTAQGERLFLVGDLAEVPANWTNVLKLDCLQMICPRVENLSLAKEIEILQLTEKDNQELVELIHYVQPGYFYKDTPLLGRYFGIRQGDKLVAVAGERMRIPGYTEISAVCTHPLFTGKGFAQKLVTYVAQLNEQEDNLPFLHVLSTNKRAINIYKKIGFIERKSITFWQLVLNSF